MIKNFLRKIISDVGNNNESNRDQWVKLSLKNMPEGLVILDVGAGQQKYRSDCCHLKYTSQDFCQYSGNDSDVGLQSANWDTSGIDIVSDITSIPVSDESFDVILCTEVLEHIPDPISALKEFYRILRPDGILIITVPFCSFTHMAPYHFYSGFNRYFFQHHLPAIGFEISELIQNGNFNEFLAQELRRLPIIFPSLPISISIAYRWILSFLGKSRLTNSLINELACFGFHVCAHKIIKV